MLIIQTRNNMTLANAKRFYKRAKSLLPGIVYIGIDGIGYQVKYCKIW